MGALYAICWFIALLVSAGIIFHVVGFSGLTRMFPEGERWWHLPAQLLSLILFAIVVLNHPF